MSAEEGVEIKFVIGATAAISIHSVSPQCVQKNVRGRACACDVKDRDAGERVTCYRECYFEGVLFRDCSPNRLRGRLSLSTIVTV